MGGRRGPDEIRRESWLRISRREVGGAAAAEAAAGAGAGVGELEEDVTLLSLWSWAREAVEEEED